MHSFARCDSYAAAEDALRRVLADIGGFAAHGFEKGMRVIVKPNLIRAMAPDKHATTHPEIVRAACRLLREEGMEPFIAESPGGPYNAGLLRSVYNACGITAVCEQEEIAYNLETRVYVQKLAGHTLKTADFILPLQSADAVLNLPKLKTHGLTLYTGAVKNLFGLIPGTAKAQAHYQYSQREVFLHMLLDIYEYVSQKPLLHIMDAVTGMEGNGPTSGTPRDVGCIAAADNALEMDAACAGMIGIADLPLLKLARERGLLGSLEASLGLPAADFAVDFALPEASESALLLSRQRFFQNHPKLRGIADAFLRPKPVIGDNCVGCGICARDCPPRTISIVKGRARIHSSKCIYCFCCQELCPHHAVQTKSSLVYRLLR